MFVAEIFNPRLLAPTDFTIRRWITVLVTVSFRPSAVRLMLVEMVVPNSLFLRKLALFCCAFFAERDLSGIGASIFTGISSNPALF